MTTRNASFLASSKTAALLLSIMVTTVWLGAVLAGFDSVGKPAPRRIELASVTVVYKAAPQVAQLVNADDNASPAAGQL